MKRRSFLAMPLGLLSGSAFAADDYPPVVRGRALRFPRDHGSHPQYRTEWWYVTGWLEAEGKPLGVQITFFRNRPRLADGRTEQGASRFAARELLFAHAALADPAAGRLEHDQRAARSGFGLARAAEAGTDIAIDDWSLRLDGERYRAHIPAAGFGLDLEFNASGPLLLQGDRGYSRKGPGAAQASYYYSRPQLAAGGTLERKGKRIAVGGRAWLDHEWSSEVLAANAVGWDWTGINLDDGGALMAFRIRDAEGRSVWGGGALRDAQGRVTPLAPEAVRFEPRRRWRSPRSGADYPVAMRVRAGGMVIELEPLMDDQELDSRASTGTIYWEGAVRARVVVEGTIRAPERGDGAVRAKVGSTEIGRGYLELTGYWQALKL